MTKSYDALPWILRVILQFFFGYFVSIIYRICKGIEGKFSLSLVLGIIMSFFFIGWIIDFITVLFGSGIVVLAS